LLSLIFSKGYLLIILKGKSLKDAGIVIIVFVFINLFLIFFLFFIFIFIFIFFEGGKDKTGGG
jgi:hypothetical protein